MSLLMPVVNQYKQIEEVTYIARDLEFSSKAMESGIISSCVSTGLII